MQENKIINLEKSFFINRRGFDEKPSNVTYQQKNFFLFLASRIMKQAFCFIKNFFIF